MKAVAVVGLVILSIFVGFSLGKRNIFSESTNTSSLIEEISRTTPSQTNSKTYQWKMENEITLFIVINRLEKGCDKDIGFESCDELTVFDQKGKKLFRLEDFRIYIDEFMNLIRHNTQAIVLTNGGGTDNFMTILDYRNGKVVEILDQNEDTSIRGGYWTMPEYRTEVKGAYFKPSQIFLIQQIGGSDPNPNASIFRYKNGFYKKAGEISMQKFGDFIEKEISAK